MVERRGHPHDQKDEYKQLSVKVHKSTYENLKKCVDKTDRDLSNISAVVETACREYTDDKEICWTCGRTIKMDYSICPYCGNPILIDMREDERRFREIYLQHHIEYRGDEKYGYKLNLTLAEIRKILEGDFNFEPENCQKFSKERERNFDTLIEKRRIATHKRLQYQRNIINQKNKSE